MIKRELGLTGLSISPIGFGGIPIQRLEQDQVDAIIDQLICEQLNFIDTARAYTTSESMIGRALRGGKRTHFIIATKSMSKSYDAMKADIQASLEALETDYIDLYQCHLVKDLEQYAQIMSEDGAYRALLEAKAEGKIRHIGITAHSYDFLASVINDLPFETIQFPFNLIERQGEPLFDIAAKRGIGVIVMKPMAGGAITSGPLSLKFILNNPHVSVAIPGMDSPIQVIENASVLKSDFTLNEQEQEEISNLRATLGANFCRRCGYCLPCPQGIDIPTQFLLEGYLKRYNLSEWAHTRYANQSTKASDCIACGSCEPKCPYDLSIIEMLTEVSKAFE